MPIFDPGMPPREEAALALREMATAAKGEERPRLRERISVVAWIVLATLVGTVIAAVLLARS